MARRSPTSILDATLALIAKGGIDSVRYRDIARESGVPLGTISYQYPSREELIRSAFKHYLEGNEVLLCRFAESARVREPRDVAKLIVDVLQAGFPAPERAHMAEFELLVYAGRDPQMADMLHAWYRQLATELGYILESVRVPSPLGTAETLLDLAWGFQLVRLGRAEPDFDELRLRIERVLDGFSANTATSPPTPPTNRRSKSRK